MQFNPLPEHTPTRQPYYSNHIYFDSITTSPPKEGTHVTDKATDKYTTFYTIMQLVIKTGIKALKVKLDLSTQANTILLSCYKKIVSYIFTKAANPNQGALQPTDNTWMSHDGGPQPFFGQSVIDVQQIPANNFPNSIPHFQRCSKPTNHTLLCNI